jgi:type II secretory pathway pseudopilin PulG
MTVSVRTILIVLLVIGLVGALAGAGVLGYLGWQADQRAIALDGLLATAVAERDTAQDETDRVQADLASARSSAADARQDAAEARKETDDLLEDWNSMFCSVDWTFDFTSQATVAEGLRDYGERLWNERPKLDWFVIWPGFSKTAWHTATFSDNTTSEYVVFFTEDSLDVLHWNSVLDINSQCWIGREP